VNKNILSILVVFIGYWSCMLKAELYMTSELPSTAYSKPVYKIGGVPYARRGGAGFTSKSREGIKVNISGLVKHESFWDTRQLNSFRDGEVVNFPLNVDLDPTGKDINKAGQFDMLGIQTTLNLDVSGLKIAHADMSGNISVDFRGVNDCVIQALRSINTYMELDWKKVLVRLGHTWIPCFVIDCFPETVSYGAGSPFECFGNAGQITMLVQVHLKIVLWLYQVKIYDVILNQLKVKMFLVAAFLEMASHRLCIYSSEN
jgi:hypothetical protein